MSKRTFRFRVILPTTASVISAVVNVFLLVVVIIMFINIRGLQEDLVQREQDVQQCAKIGRELVARGLAGLDREEVLIRQRLAELEDRFQVNPAEEAQ